jgi:transcriptional regulator with XRE-family HTH domain
MGKNLDFGKKIVEVRKAKGLTQDEVAERCKVSTRTIQRIESGEVAPRAFTIKAISEALGFDFFEASNASCEANKKSRYARLKFYATDLFNLKTHAMRKISILATFGLAVAFAVLAFAPKAEAQKMPNFINTPERVEVAFTDDFTIDSLDFIKNELQKRGITVSYKKATFDKTGHLIAISVSVDCGDGFSGGFNNEGDPLSVFFSYGKDLKPMEIGGDRRYGFFRDYRKNAKTPFATGCLNCDGKGFWVEGYSVPNPLYIVDGKEVDSSVFKSIPAEKIERITVLRDQSAIEQYGEKAKDGVVVVTLKK